MKLTPFHGHLIVLSEGVRNVQTVHPQAALSGAISCLAFGVSLRAKVVGKGRPLAGCPVEAEGPSGLDRNVRAQHGYWRHGVDIVDKYKPQLNQ